MTRTDFFFKREGLFRWEVYQRATDGKDYHIVGPFLRKKTAWRVADALLAARTDGEWVGERVGIDPNQAAQEADNGRS